MASSIVHLKNGAILATIKYSIEDIIKIRKEDGILEFTGTDAAFMSLEMSPAGQLNVNIRPINGKDVLWGKIIYVYATEIAAITNMMDELEKDLTEKFNEPENKIVTVDDNIVLGNFGDNGNSR